LTWELDRSFVFDILRSDLTNTRKVDSIVSYFRRENK